MCIIDRIKILGIEVRHSDTDSFSKAIDFALYSNRKLAVNSFRSIFDILWNERVLNEKLKANDKAQKDFINIAAHELRTPIQPIIGLSEVLRQRKLEGQLQQDKILDTIIRNAKRVQNLSGDLLDVARIESNSLSLKKEKFNLNQLILNAITDSRNYIASENMSSNNNNINIEPIFKEKVDIYLEADKNRINQVILNLLVNAIRFTKKGTNVFLLSFGESYLINKLVYINYKILVILQIKENIYSYKLVQYLCLFLGLTGHLEMSVNILNLTGRRQTS